MATFRPYLADYPENSFPTYAANANEFKSDLKPMFSNMAKDFGNIRTQKMQHKFCYADCDETRKCSKKCCDFITKRLNETVRIPNNHLTCLDAIFDGIERGEDPDTIVLVNDYKFACTGIVLGTYSKYFGRLHGHAEVDLRKSPIAANTFDWVYKWMVQPHEQVVYPKFVLSIIQAAYYLEIPNLIQQCYIMLDDPIFGDFEAFGILHQLGLYTELSYISLAMISRISSSAMIIMCTRQFLELTVEQICHFLESNVLAINSETELLFGLMHWLRESWSSRAIHLLRVFKLIRFAYLSPQLLVQLNSTDHNQIWPFEEILSEFSKLPESKKLIADGIFYSTLVITMGGDPEQLMCVPSANLELMKPRRWMQDTRCKYHQPVTRLVPNMRYINYDDFVDYSQILQDSDRDYESFLKFPDYDNINCNEAENHRIYLSSTSTESLTNSSDTEKSETLTLSPSVDVLSMTPTPSSPTRPSTNTIDK